MIVTSRSAIQSYQRCPRLRYHWMEQANGTDTPGYERKKLSVALSTGIWVHKGVELALKGNNASEASLSAKKGYLEDVAKRGLEVRDGVDESKVVEEQAAHVEALVIAWCRVRLPRWLAEYQIVEVEVENRLPLAEDVTLAARFDAIVRRKRDRQMFVVNFKTVAQADDRWKQGFEVDMQMTTELLAAESKYGCKFGGVIIEGLIKGARIAEKDDSGKIVGYRDSTPLLYAYKNSDGAWVEYDYETRRQKGWDRIQAWKEFAADYWVNWLPEEVVESRFVTLPPISRSPEKITSKVIQIVMMERNVLRCIWRHMNTGHALNHFVDIPEKQMVSLEEGFPQNESACYRPSKCQMFDVCHNGVNPATSDLYQIRTDHHEMNDED